MNKDRNDLLDLLSPNWKPTQRQLQPTEEQRERFARRQLSCSETSESNTSPSRSRPRDDSAETPSGRRTLRRGSTIGNLAAGISRRGCA